MDKEKPDLPIRIQLVCLCKYEKRFLTKLSEFIFPVIVRGSGCWTHFSYLYAAFRILRVLQKPGHAGVMLWMCPRRRMWARAHGTAARGRRVITTIVMRGGESRAQPWRTEGCSWWSTTTTREGCSPLPPRERLGAAAWRETFGGKVFTLGGVGQGYPLLPEDVDLWRSPAQILLIERKYKKSKIKVHFRESFC